MSTHARVIITAIALLAATAAHADELNKPNYTGASLQRACRGDGNRGWCYGYVAAAAEWINFVSTDRGGLICIPEAARQDEQALVDVVGSYLDAHADVQDKDAITVMTFALSDAYPCRNPGPRP